MGHQGFSWQNTNFWVVSIHVRNTAAMDWIIMTLKKLYYLS